MKAYKNYAEKNLKFVRTEFESKSLDCVMNTVLTVIFCYYCFSLSMYNEGKLRNETCTNSIQNTTVFNFHTRIVYRVKR